MKKEYYYICPNGVHGYICSSYSSTGRMFSCPKCGKALKEKSKLESGPSMLPEKISDTVTEWYRY